MKLIKTGQPYSGIYKSEIRNLKSDTSTGSVTESEMITVSSIKNFNVILRHKIKEWK